MIYLTLKDIEQSHYRVNERVSTGGHSVDDKNIRENYNFGLQYLERFADRFDNLDIIDASRNFDEYTLLLKVEQQRLVYLKDNLPASVEQTVNNIADLYRNNSKGYNLDR